MVPMGSQESFRVVKGLSVFLWGLCKVRGPHLVLRWEPQISSPVLTRISGCVCSFKQGVRSQLLWRHGALFSSQVVKEVAGLQFSSIGFLWLFSNLQPGSQSSLHVVS